MFSSIQGIHVHENNENSKDQLGYRFTKALTQIVKLRNYFLL